MKKEGATAPLPVHPSSFRLHPSLPCRPSPPAPPARILPATRVPVPAPAMKKPDLDRLLEKRTFAGGAGLPYRLLRPGKVEAGVTYPLVVFLHGAGERGDDNEAQLAHGVAWFAADETRKKHPCFLAAPQCPKNA